MAELTNLETKLGEVIGLAMAAQVSIDRVAKLANGERDLARQMKTMRSRGSGGREARAPQLAGTLRRQEEQDPRRGPDRKKKGGDDARRRTSAATPTCWTGWSS